MANEDGVGAAGGELIGENAQPFEGASLTGNIAPPSSANEFDLHATLIQTRGGQTRDGSSSSHSDESRANDVDFKKFYKSVEARIDPEDPPNLLLTEPDLHKVGTIQIGPYTCPLIDQIALIKKLGEGGNGTVFLGYQHRFGEVALKTLKPKVANSDNSIVGRFFLEARLSKKFSSPNIVKTFDARTEGGLNFLVMEYIAGVDASGYLKKLKKEARESGAVVGLPEIEALRICAAACTGLAALHEYGVMHRDIKPQNIMVPYGRNNELKFESSKLMDLGLAKTTDDDAPSVMKKDLDPTLSGTLLGTPGYMAPEQVMDCSSVTAAADIFSLGATLYCLMCGSPPFRDVQGAVATASATIHGNHIPIAERCQKSKIAISRGTATIIEQCLRKNANERYTDANELLADLKRVLEGHDPLAKRRSKKWLPTWAWIAGGSAVAAAVVVIVLFFNPYAPTKLEAHSFNITKAYESLDQLDLENATEFANRAVEARLQSKYRRSLDLMDTEKKLNAKIEDERNSIKTATTKLQDEFHQFVATKRFDDAATKLTALEAYHAFVDLKQLKTEFSTAKANWEALKAAEEKKRREEEAERVRVLDQAFLGIATSLAGNRLSDAEEWLAKAKKLAVKESETTEVAKQSKAVFREKHIAEIKSILGDAKRDVSEANQQLSEIKASEPGHAVIAELGALIAVETKRREVVKSLDEKITQLKAGTGDLGDVNALLAELKVEDPDRVAREKMSKQALSDFNTALNGAKQHIRDNADLGAAEAALAAATRIWKSSPELTAQRTLLASANDGFKTLVGDVKNSVASNLSEAEAMLARARKIRPDSADIKECDGLVAAEKTLQGRIAALQSGVTRPESQKEFDDFKIELDACIALRKDARLDSVKAVYETRLKEHREKLLVAALGQLNGELKELGAYGDGALYKAFQQRMEKVAGGAADDARVIALMNSFAQKNKDAEEKSVFGVGRNLEAKSVAFQNKSITLKQFEDEVISAEGKFAASAFAKQRKVMEDGKNLLTQKLAEANAIVREKANLDAAQSIVSEIDATYPALDGLAATRQQIAELNTAYAADVQAMRAKLDAAQTKGGNLEGLEDTLARSLKLHPQDIALSAIQKSFAPLKEAFANVLASIPAASESGNVDDADKKLNEVSKLFPNDAGIPKAKQQLSDARVSLQKELTAAEPVLADPAKGDFKSASAVLDRVQKRIPADTQVAKLTDSRKKTLAENERMISDLTEMLSISLTDQSLKKSQEMMKKVDLIGPNDTVNELYKKRKTAYDLKLAQEESQRRIATQVQPRTPDAPNKPTARPDKEGPD